MISLWLQVFLVLPVRARRWSRLARTVVLMTLMTSLMTLSALRMFKEGVSLTSSCECPGVTGLMYPPGDLYPRYTKPRHEVPGVHEA